MEYKIVEKAAFTVLGASKVFPYETATTDIPAFWSEFFAAGKGATVCGTYGINIDEAMGGDNFEYLIADNYSGGAVPEGFATKEIPGFTWAVFPCSGPMPATMQRVNEEIYSQWLPTFKDYEIAAGYCVEMYNNPADYPKGTMDENYYSEIWIPVKRK